MYKSMHCTSWCVVGGSTELGAGSVWAVGIKEQSVVLDRVGEIMELGAGSVWAVKISLLKNYIHVKYFHMLSVFKNIFYNEKSICSPLHVNGSIRPLSCACGHLVRCLLRLLVQTGLQPLHGYLTGLLTILGALKKPP